MQDGRATTGKTSSLKLKELQNWNSLAKVERCALRGCSEDESRLLPANLVFSVSARPRRGLFPFVRATSPSTVRINSRGRLRENYGNALDRRQIWWRNGRVDADFSRTAKFRASDDCEKRLRGVNPPCRNTESNCRLIFGEWKRADLATPR